MNISVPRERRPDEHRVGLTPAAVALLAADGHRCYVETGAGLGAGFADDDYARAGATMVSHPFNIRKVAHFADVLVGAVLAPGRRTPVLVPRALLREMRPRSIILDIAIDQGGCVETSRPTSHLPPLAHVCRREHRPLLRAEHVGGAGAHGHARPQQCNVALHSTSGRARRGDSRRQSGVGATANTERPFGLRLAGGSLIVLRIGVSHYGGSFGRMSRFSFSLAEV
ncbi:MAG: hypothetical protein FJ030_02350 [Chloroflexi bacterium]|nr:hypothetical protein [Chloroflexota bacterium]